MRVLDMDKKTLRACLWCANIMLVVGFGLLLSTADIDEPAPEYMQTVAGVVIGFALLCIVVLEIALRR
jgi:hypothetical protein